MCHIAGYVGTKQAAPVLLDMIRRQEYYDGNVCTGIATLHNGRIYYRKVVGDVETLINTTDALYLPGTIGLAHTRPGGNPKIYNHGHPFVTMDESMAGIANGTTNGPNYTKICQEITTALEKEGYAFRDSAFVDSTIFPKLSDGSTVNTTSTRLVLTEKYIKEGMSVSAALAKSNEELYSDVVFSVLNVATPDRFYVLRTTRPALSLKTDDGVYVTTSRFGFPEELRDDAQMLPLFSPCEITKDEVIISNERMTKCEEVAEVTDHTLEEGYKRICEMLKGKKDSPLHFDDLEIAVGKNMRDLFEGNHYLVQDARLVYDILYRLDKEGVLKRELRRVSDRRQRWFMWID